MNLKFYVYLISIVCLSLLTGFNEWILESSFDQELFIGIGLLLIFHWHFYKLYNLLLNKEGKSVITKGLLYSALIGVFILILVLQGDYSYEKTIRENVTESGSYIYYYLAGAYIIISLICFVIDAFFNNKMPERSKSKILFSAILFYVVLYLGSYSLAFFIGIMKGVSFS